ncbi:unnamed protein product [Closterium sp. NIES-65]|nr:unnamed protein product [Closterium sp. NIES-65]
MNFDACSQNLPGGLSFDIRHSYPTLQPCPTLQAFPNLQACPTLQTPHAAPFLGGNPYSLAFNVQSASSFQSHNAAPFLSENQLEFPVSSARQCGRIPLEPPVTENNNSSNSNHDNTDNYGENTSSPPSRGAFDLQTPNMNFDAPCDAPCDAATRMIRLPYDLHPPDINLPLPLPMSMSMSMCLDLDLDAASPAHHPVAVSLPANAAHPAGAARPAHPTDDADVAAAAAANSPAPAAAADAVAAAGVAAGINGAVGGESGVGGDARDFGSGGRGNSSNNVGGAEGEQRGMEERDRAGELGGNGELAILRAFQQGAGGENAESGSAEGAGGEEGENRREQQAEQGLSEEGGGQEAGADAGGDTGGDGGGDGGGDVGGMALWWDVGPAPNLDIEIAPVGAPATRFAPRLIFSLDSHPPSTAATAPAPPAALNANTRGAIASRPTVPSRFGGFRESGSATGAGAGVEASCACMPALLPPSLHPSHPPPPTPLRLTTFHHQRGEEAFMVQHDVENACMWALSRGEEAFMVQHDVENAYMWALSVRPEQVEERRYCAARASGGEALCACMPALLPLPLHPYPPNQRGEEAFMVQHDVENAYMWALSVRPEHALGKMQLRSFINGNSRVDEPCFPFPEKAGFARSHRLQRRRYKGLANPLCIHGIAPVPAPDLSAVSPHSRMRWEEITGELVAVRCRTQGETS